MDADFPTTLHKAADYQRWMENPSGRPLSMRDHRNYEGLTEWLQSGKYPVRVKNWWGSISTGRGEYTPFKTGVDRYTYSGAPDYTDVNASQMQTTPRQSGGSIPTMLTAGEGYVPEALAKRMGYDNLSHMNDTGNIPIIKGPGGVDNVGPMGLNPGDFIIKRGSTDKLLRENPNMMRFAMQNPDGFRRAAAGYYEGGLVGDGDMAYSQGMEPAATQDGTGGGNRMNLLAATDTTRSSEVTDAKINETTNNININVSIDRSGAESTKEEGDAEADYSKEKELSAKIKNAVVEVIREEKRIGGELN